MNTEFEKDLKHLELTEMNERAENAVAVAAAATAATGVIPIPFADAPMMIAEEVALIIIFWPGKIKLGFLILFNLTKLETIVLYFNAI